MPSMMRATPAITFAVLSTLFAAAVAEITQAKINEWKVAFEGHLKQRLIIWDADKRERILPEKVAGEGPYRCQFSPYRIYARCTHGVFYRLGCPDGSQGGVKLDDVKLLLCGEEPTGRGKQIKEMKAAWKECCNYVTDLLNNKFICTPDSNGEWTNDREFDSIKQAVDKVFEKATPKP